MTVPVCTGPCATGAERAVVSRRRSTALGLLWAWALSLSAFASSAGASDVSVEAALRLPPAARAQPERRLEQAVFQPLQPYALDEVPVRLPADQALTPTPPIGVGDRADAEVTDEVKRRD